MQTSETLSMYLRHLHIIDMIYYSVTYIYSYWKSTTEPGKVRTDAPSISQLR